MEIIKTDCGLCVDSCGVDACVENGKLVKVAGMKEHPATKGHLCPKGKRLVEYVYSPDRVLYPQIKGRDGIWKRASWDEALGLCATKLQDIKEKFEAHALTIYCGSVGVEHVEAAAFAQRFKGAYGTPNFISVESGCFRARILTRQLTFGRYTIPDECKYTKLMLLWGHDPENSMSPMGPRMREAIQNGTQIISINPMRTSLAENGTYIQIRPGTDCALALAMINVIITEDLYDKEFVEKWTHGFDKLAEHVKAYTPERVEKITWVPAIEIKRIARKFATTKPAAIHQGTAGLDRQITNVHNSRALSILMAITGNIDVRGGWVPFMPFFISDLRLPVTEEPIGAEEYPLFNELWGRKVPYGHQMVWPERVMSGQPYPIKALMVTCGNPVVTLPEPKKWVEAIKKLDFVVSLDLFMTETAELADVILPPCTFMETLGMGGYTIAGNFSIPHIQLRHRCIEPLGESKPDWLIWAELARKMGYGEHFPWKTDEEMLDFLFKPSNITVEDLKKHPNGVMYREKVVTTNPQQFRTPSGKIELYSDTLAKLGHPPMPVHIEPHESPVATPELAEEYPLILMTGRRQVETLNSQLLQMTEIRALVPEPLVEIHPATADKYGVKDGEMVRVSSPTATIKIRTKFNPGIAQGVVTIPHGWSQANACHLLNMNHRDPIMGYPNDKAIQCRISRM